MVSVSEFKTISNTSEGLYKEKGSKFIAYAFPVNSLESIKECLQKIREKEYAARHHCYAYRIGADGKKYRANDDGEPAHSAGDPILGQIDSNQLTNVLIVVVRYFGGTKLGVGGLINAYRTAAKESLLINEIVTKAVRIQYKLTFEYDAMNIAMRYIKQYQAKIVSQDMALSCAMTIELDKDKSLQFQEAIELSRKIEIKLLD